MERKRTNWIRSCVILVLSIIMIVAGVNRGEVQTVFKKASNICLECIGIG